MIREIGGIFVVQLFVMLMAASLCLLIDFAAAYSAILGGLVCFIPGLYSGFRIQRKIEDDDNGLAPVLIGELGKLILTIALFIVVFVLVKPLDVVSFFGTFVALQLVYIAVPLFKANRLRYRRK